jgi:hypothetical protein
MSTSTLDDPEHWRQRAAEMRAMVDRTTDPASRHLLLDIAQDCEWLAADIERRAEKFQPIGRPSISLTRASRHEPVWVPTVFTKNRDRGASRVKLARKSELDTVLISDLIASRLYAHGHICRSVSFFTTVNGAAKASDRLAVSLRVSTP